jgi:Reverse transcriptase (RNA-dependent DNA polymerase)
VNLCTLDVSKAFDKMNHHGLFIKLMNRLMPLTLSSALEDWFGCSYTFVKWIDSASFSFKLAIGVRQGGVLSPYQWPIWSFVDFIK